MLVERLVAHLSSIGDLDLRSQLVGLRVSSIDADGSHSLTPSTDVREFPELSGVILDAEGRDKDGETVFCLLHVKRGALFELEFYRGDGRTVQADLTSDDFTVVYPLAKRRRPVEGFAAGSHDSG